MMHKAVARELLRKSGWTEPQITMALRIIAHDGARAVTQVASVLQGFAERCEEPPEGVAWRALAARVAADPREAEALWALRAW